MGSRSDSRGEVVWARCKRQTTKVNHVCSDTTHLLNQLWNLLTPARHAVRPVCRWHHSAAVSECGDRIRARESKRSWFRIIQRESDGTTHREQRWQGGGKRCAGPHSRPPINGARPRVGGAYTEPRCIRQRDRTVGVLLRRDQQRLLEEPLAFGDMTVCCV